MKSPGVTQIYKFDGEDCAHWLAVASLFSFVMLYDVNKHNEEDPSAESHFKLSNVIPLRKAVD